MTNNHNGNQFRDDEIIILEQLRDGKMVKNIFPKIGGRLRLAHEENDQLSISTETIAYDENLAAVRAVITTMKGSFQRIGMASLMRAHCIALLVDQVSQPVRKINPGQCRVVAGEVDRPIRFADKQAGARRFLARHAFE
jgi:hypothetical protein